MRSPRRRGRTTYVMLFVLLGLALAVSGTPSPLYGTYAREWRLSPLDLTVVFAVYALAAMSALLVAGPLTDAIGRKPVLLMSAVGLLAGLAVFMTAHSIVGLLIARVIHGASIGSAAVAVGAALLDVRPDDTARTGHLTGIVLASGMGVGVLGSAVLAQLLPHPLVLPYAVIAALTALTLIVLALSPETHGARTGRIRIVRPGVPAPIAADFAFATLGAMASWIVLGIYLSLFPQLTAQETGIHSLIFGGSAVAAMTFSAAVAQALTRHAGARRLALYGDVGLVAASLLSIPMVLSGHAIAVFVGSVALGGSFGMTFSGSFRHLTQVIPAAQRGSVMSAFYLCCYAAMAVPTILAGAAASRWGLPHTYAGFAVVVAMACGAAGMMAYRSAPPVTLHVADRTGSMSR
ncbi:MFS transporter [Leekyejoonella antrihumi]|uniref:MFS transporter n=2 Tax=Leekyejoonella antrihumi TaxID=1660198 RepID=A0A563DV61_9MICO|nr:MFS transporter [Leekyejoonella antrihumi]